MSNMRKVLDSRIKTSKSKQDPHAGIGNSKYGRPLFSFKAIAGVTIYGKK